MYSMLYLPTFIIYLPMYFPRFSPPPCGESPSYGLGQGPSNGGKHGQAAMLQLRLAAGWNPQMLLLTYKPHIRG